MFVLRLFRTFRVSRHYPLFPFAVLLAGGIFAFDLALPLGVAGGVPYVAVILLSLWSRRVFDVYFAAAGCSLLITLGYFLSPEGGVLWVTVLNRALALFSIWVTAILVVLSQTLRVTTEEAHRRTGEALALDDMAHIDAVTGLPNRALFTVLLKHAVALARRSGKGVTLHYIDLDHFKHVNDRWGHAVGDALLEKVGRRLKRSVREVDTVARLGGDEFGIIQEAAKGTSAATTLAERVLAELSTPFTLKGLEINATTSIGIATSPPADSADELMQQADIALYRSKSDGRHRFRFHDQEMQKETERHLTLRGDMYRALERRQFFLEYQPQVDLTNGNLVGIEALVRWEHPTRGLLQPAEFIPIAEDTGLIVPLGEWVLREACETCKSWCDETQRAISVAVNVSARQFGNDDFGANVIGILEETGLAPRQLELELTESLLLNGGPTGEAFLLMWYEHGIKLAIDDFGTGYSSLSYLGTFPVQKLKIDPTFVQGLQTSSNHAAIVNAVISLGHKLGLGIIAEGIETLEQLAFLRASGCDEAQGFYFDKPVLPEFFSKFSYPTPMPSA